MPEGDAIYRAARALHNALAGHKVIKFETAYAHLARVDVDTPLVGRAIERCEAAGKHLLIRFQGDLILRTHMRMSGSWHLYRHGERWQRAPHTMRLRLDTEQWVAVAFNVPVAEFISSRTLETTDPVATLGPDLLKPNFDRAEAVRRVIAAGAMPIADALLNQRLVTGMGNIYKCEVLFLAGVHPDTPASGVPVAQLEPLLDTAQSLLAANVREGTPGQIQTYRSLRRTDKMANASDSFWVYARAGKPCRKCGTPIESKQSGLNARRTYWCPRCQPDRIA